MEDNIAGKPTVHVFYSGADAKVTGGVTFGGLDIGYSSEKEVEQVLSHAKLSKDEKEYFDALSTIETGGLTRSEIKELNKTLRNDKLDSLAQKVRNGLVLSTKDRLVNGRRGKHGNPDGNPFLNKLSDEQWGALISMGIKNKEIDYAMYDTRIKTYSDFTRLVGQRVDAQRGVANTRHYKSLFDTYFKAKKG